MILCCGEALIDMIPTPTTPLATTGGDDVGRMGYVPHSGGAIFNTAIALGRLGVKTGMLSGVSSDLFGDQLGAALTASHVDTSHIVRSDRPTTLAFVNLVDGHATYTFYDENSAGRMLNPEDLPTVSADVSALYFGGISLACEPGAEAYATLAAHQGAGRVVMLDPNIRPGFVDDVSRYRARLEAMIGLADIVKVSDEDLDWLVPGPDALSNKVGMLGCSGRAIVIVTRGRHGATAYLASGDEISVPANPVEIVDTVGAGDTFNAGVLARLSELGFLTKDALIGATSAQIGEALSFGAKVAAVTVSRAGANPPWATELIA